VQRGSRFRRQVALTFDDGPGDATAAVLDVLAALQVPATFFVIGQQVPERAALLRRMVDDGHAVGVHAWEHPDLAAEPERAPAELDRCLAAVREAAGATPSVFRPPLGRWAPALLETASARGLETVLWDVNPHDYAGGDATADSIVADVLAAVRRGSIVLLHDGGPAESRAGLLAALPRIAAGLRDRDLQPVTVPELVRLPGARAG
jgi:peptidoglycan/xylan/chitin deacetylase (PgdA/CDA1 family)